MTLLEAVIALSILMVGMVGTFQLQVFGTYSDSGARAHTQALQVARELLVALEQLGPEDARILENFSGTDDPPADFGRLLKADGAVSTAAFHGYSDSLALAGVTTDAQLVARAITDSVNPAAPRFQRRWTSWAPSGPITGNTSKLLAVSVMWRERGLGGLREVVLYGQVINPAAVTAYANFYR
jgi:type IV pilus assembly protein PilV